MSPSVIIRDEDWVAFDRSTGAVLDMNTTGYLIIKLIQSQPRGITLGKLVDTMAEVYKIPDEQIQSDASEFARTLEANDLISATPGGQENE
jgi:chemotaxis signal transduction protein